MSHPPVSLAEQLAGISEHWRPRTVAQLNGQAVKLVKFQGEFVWHHHPEEDELFLVLEGRFRMDFRDQRGTRPRRIAGGAQGNRAQAGRGPRGIGHAV